MLTNKIFNASALLPICFATHTERSKHVRRTMHALTSNDARAYFERCTAHNI